MRNVFYFSKKVRLFSQNDVLFLFYFLINLAGTTVVYLINNLQSLRLHSADAFQLGLDVN